MKHPLKSQRLSLNTLIVGLGLVLAIGLTEFAIMQVLPWLQRLLPWCSEAVIDATLLIAIIVPLALYLGKINSASARDTPSLGSEKEQNNSPIKLVSISIVLASVGIACILYMSELSGNLQLLQKTARSLDKVKINLLTLRLHEKDFITRRQLWYATTFNQEFNTIKSMSSQLAQNLQKLGFKETSIKLSSVDGNDYRQYFQDLVSLIQRAGLTHDSGLEGSLRASIHQAEKIVSRLNDKGLFTIMLQLRRSEKDFLLRSDIKYIAEFNRHYHHFEEVLMLTKSEMTPAEYAKISKSMVRYKNNFSAYSELKKEIGLDERSGKMGALRNAAHTVEEHLDTTTKLINAEIATYQTIQQYALLGSILLLILILLLVVYFLTRWVQLNRHIRLSEALRLDAEQATIAKADFLANMSHEIRTPMNGVLGMLGLLKESQLDEQQMRRVNMAEDSAHGLLNLINDILDFSKIEAGKLSLESVDFNLRKLLDDCSESTGLRAAEKGLELILDTSQVEHSMVTGDPSRLRQILNNLLGNALKFTERGDIVIRAALTDNTEGGLILCCSVSDTGIGIPADKLSDLFGVFTQADASTTRKYGGTGLGLSITKQLCELMGGSIGVTSKLGEGSIFQFNILLYACEQSVCVLPAADISQLKILIVDDNETNLAVLKGQLGLWGATVTEASNAKSALTLLNDRYGSTKSKYFDLALLDMQMPDMDGAALGQCIRADPRFNEVSLVMMTSMDDNNDIQYFADLGFQAYFPKPVTTEDLFKALNVVADGGTALAQAAPLVTAQYLRELAPATSTTDMLSDAIHTDEIHILLVEDNMINQEVVIGMLEDLDIRIDIANDGLEALKTLKENAVAHPYQLVLMDCQMPNMDGYEATGAIRRGEAGETYKTIPIVAMTANAMKGDREKCLDAGMSDYMSKPIDPDDLEATILKYTQGPSPI